MYSYYSQVAFQQADFAGWNLWAAINNRHLLPFRFELTTFPKDIFVSFSFSIIYVPFVFSFYFLSPPSRVELNCNLFV